MAYRLYLDEVGTDDLGSVQEDAHRFLSLTGIIMHREHARTQCVPRLNAIKNDLFNPDPDIAVVFHRTDIVGKKGPFEILNDDHIRAEFDGRILESVAEIDYTAITAVIDKQAMMQQHHWNNRHPYHYLMEIVVEKYVLWLERKNGVGDIMPEERKGKKDAALQRAYDSVRTWGTYYVPAHRIRKRLPASELKFRNKRDNVAGLQLCDLVAHPSYIHVRDLHGDAVTPGAYASQIIQILRTGKYDRSWDGRIKGYGTKYLP